MLFNVFMKSFALRSGASLSSLKIHPSRSLELPDDSALHYIDAGTTELGISRNHSLVLNYKKDIRVFHETDLEVVKGRARRTTLSTKIMETQYFKNQTGMRRAKDIDKILTSRRNMVVYDYSFLTHGIDYSENIFTPYNEWYNLRNALIKGLNKTTPLRESFVYIRVPKVIPSIGDFKMLEEELASNHVNKWHNFEILDLRALWLLVEGKGIYATLEKEALEKLTFVISGFGGFSIIRATDLLFEEDDNGSVSGTQKKLHDIFERFIELKTSVELDKQEADEQNKSEEGEVSLKISETISGLGSIGKLSGAEQKRLIQMAKAVNEIPSPFSDKPLVEFAKVEAKDTEITRDVPNSIKKIIDPELLKSSVSNWDKRYIAEVMQKDIANMVLKMKDSGVIVKEYNVSSFRDIKDNYFEYEVKVQPVTGKASTIKFQIPKVDKDGRFMFNGTRYTMDSQRVDVPIRKSGPDKVALTSYYGKVFLQRSTKVVDNYSAWLIREIGAAGLDSSNRSIMALQYGNVMSRTEKVPMAYSAIASKMEGFTSGRFKYSFNYAKREDTYGLAAIKKYEHNGNVLCAMNSNDEYITISPLNTLTIHKGNEEPRTVGLIENFILPDAGDAPINYANISIFGKAIPAVVALSYLIGFEKLLKRLKVKYRTIATGTREPVEAYEIPIKFKDETVIIDGRNPVHALLFAGMRPVRKIIHAMRLDQMAHKEAYGPIVTPMKAHAFHLRELGLMDDMFIDPITEEILKKKDQPTNFFDLAMYALELLTDDRYPDETDPEFQRIRGLERMSGMVYFRLVEGLRAHRNSRYENSAVVDVNPFSVKRDIVSDQTVLPSDNINPLHGIKEMESVNLGGAGGRDASTLMKKSRIFHKNDLGLISEATADSGKVGIRTTLTPNANLSDLRGLSSRYEDGQNANRVLSTTALLMPGSNHDKPLSWIRSNTY